jgi:hypothetical protein
MRKQAEYLDNAVLTLARHGELGEYTENNVKEGIVTKKAFVHKAVSMVFDKTSELTNMPVDKTIMNKLAALVDSEFSVAHSMTLSEDDFMTAVMQKTAQLAIQLNNELKDKK